MCYYEFNICDYIFIIFMLLNEEKTMAKLSKIPANADKLTEEASIEVMCQHWDPNFDMITFFNENGYNVISSDDERATNPSTFVYDNRTNILHTPLIKPEDVLQTMQDLQQKFEQNKIGYYPFRAKYCDQFVKPLSEKKTEILSDEIVFEQLQQQNLEKISPSSLENLYKENITDNGPLKLYRGTSMGDSAHITCSTDIREMVCFATPNIQKATQYTKSETSRFSFIEEYKANPKQKYAPDHGLESDSCYDDVNWQKSEYTQYRNFETSVEKETNPHLCTYIFDNKTGEMCKIYENGKYIDKFWEQYAKSRKPQKKYSENISKRVQNIVNLKTEPQGKQSENKTPSRPSVKDKAKDFIKTSKSYAGGKNLFSKLKEKMETFAKENPKLLTAGGAAAMFAGIGSMNPQLAAAGAIVMSAGVKAWSDKLKNMRGLGKSNSSAKIQPSKPLTLDYAVHKSLTPRGER